MFGRLVSLLPGIALGALRFRQPVSPAPGPAPAALQPLVAQPAVLPNGTDVVIGGTTFEVFHIPQFRPTLSPNRMSNENPVQSPIEKQFEELGPTEAPPRDCVRTPGISNCGCKGMITACHEESYLCEVGLADLKKQAPDVLRDNYQSKFAHPLLNTLQLNASRWSQPQREPPATAQCHKCFQEMAQTLPHNEADQFLQISSKGRDDPTAPPPPETYQPEETGWKIYYGGPSWDAPGGVLRGVCGVEEMTGLEECLNYFWTCDANRVRLEKWVLNTNIETKYIDEHPGTRPGVY